MRTVFLTLLLILVDHSVWGIQNFDLKPLEGTKKVCQQLIDEAVEDTNRHNDVIAFEKLLKAQLIAEENQWDDKLWQIKNQIGLLYRYNSHYGEAIAYFHEAYNITQQQQNLSVKGIHPLINIGELYFKENKTTDALKYHLKAENLANFHKIEDEDTRNVIINNIAVAYSRLGNPNKSLNKLLEVKKYGINHQTNFFGRATYINVLMKTKQTKLANTLAEKLYIDFKAGIFKEYRNECVTCMYKLLTAIHEQNGEIDLAILYANKSVRAADELIDYISLYKKIAELYAQKNEFKKAYQYRDSVIKTKDSFSASVNRKLYEISKVKFKVQEYQSELIANKKELSFKKEQHQKERSFFILLVLLGIVLLISIYKGFQNRTIKQKQQSEITSLALKEAKQEHALAEQQLETNKLKQEKLKHEIAEKNRELSAKALYLSNRNELIQEIIDSFESNNTIKNNKEAIKHIKAIKSFLKTDMQRDDFIKHFEKVNPNFIKRLKEKHPELTANDIRFMCYIYMNLSIKEISIILNITYEASKKRRQRIVEKMNLNKNISLFNYLLKV